MKYKGGTEMSSSLVQFRVDDTLRADAMRVYERLGIDMSTALRMFLKRSVIVGGIPFSMTLSKEELKPERALDAMNLMADAAEEAGISDMTLDEINEEISASRRDRKRSAGKN